MKVDRTAHRTNYMVGPLDCFNCGTRSEGFAYAVNTPNAAISCPVCGALEAYPSIDPRPLEEPVGRQRATCSHDAFIARVSLRRFHS